jgi:Flp pilus assembly protein TadB
MGHYLGYDIPMGVLLLAGAVGWQLIGAYMIFKIVSVKV